MHELIYNYQGCDVRTPGGIGKFIRFDPTTAEVIVELQHQYIVRYPASHVYLIQEADDELSA